MHFADSEPASQPGGFARHDPSARSRSVTRPRSYRLRACDRGGPDHRHENADDFRKLGGAVGLHSGLIIILPSVARAEAQRLMDLVIQHLMDAAGERPQDRLVSAPSFASNTRLRWWKYLPMIKLRLMCGGLRRLCRGVYVCATMAIPVGGRTGKMRSLSRYRICEFHFLT